jgi:hypothetical protein
MTFFPLGAACNRNIVRIAGNVPVPAHAADFPIFRNSHHDRAGRRVGPWFLWDGRKEWRVETLTERQLQEYPPLEVWNDTLLVDRILAGWKHEDDA